MVNKLTMPVGWMSRCDSGGGSERGEKGCGSVALRQVIEKALPLPLPDTLVMPSQRATERTPAMGIEEDVVNTNGAQGVRSEDTNAHSECLVLGVVRIPSCAGFGAYLLDRRSACALHLL